MKKKMKFQRFLRNSLDSLMDFKVLQRSLIREEGLKGRSPRLRKEDLCLMKKGLRKMNLLSTKFPYLIGKIKV